MVHQCTILLTNDPAAQTLASANIAIDASNNDLESPSRVDICAIPPAITANPINPKIIATYISIFEYLFMLISFLKTLHYYKNNHLLLK